MGEMRRSARLSLELTTLLVLAVLAALYVAKEIVLPVVLAVILALIFSPVVRLLARLRISEALSAGMIVATLVVGLSAGVYNLAEPASDWLEKAPKSLREIRQRLEGPVQSVTTAREQVEALGKAISPGRTSETTVIVAQPPLGGRVLNTAQDFVFTSAITLVLLFFLLASRDYFVGKLHSVGRGAGATAAYRKAEAEISQYLLTITVINTCLGAAVALALSILGLPNAVLWGVMAGLLNFIPYLGDLASLVILTTVSVLSFDELWRGLAAPVIFASLTAVEGYLITPYVLGRRLKLDPVMVILSLLLWGWLWGPVGAILAVPILVVVKSTCDNSDSLRSFGRFLAR